MFQISQNAFVITLISFVLSIGLTYLVRGYARKQNFVATPKLDRWHKKPTAMLGGVAIFLTTTLMYLLFVPQTSESFVILAGSMFLFIVGLVDDILHIKPYQKLIGQFIGAAIAEMPAASPSILSSRFIALVMPMSQKAVIAIFRISEFVHGKTKP